MCREPVCRGANAAHNDIGGKISSLTTSICDPPDTLSDLKMFLTCLLIKFILFFSYLENLCGYRLFLNTRCKWSVGDLHGSVLLLKDSQLGPEGHWPLVMSGPWQYLGVGVGIVST